MTPTLTALTVRARRAAARPRAARLAAVTLVLVTVAAVAAAGAAARSAEARWGRTRPVVVAARDLDPGDALDPGAVRIRDLPAAAVPAAALRAVPAGATVRLPIVAGEAVVPARLAPAGLAGAAALVPAGWRAVAVPRGPAGTPPLAVGDRVDLLAVAEGDRPPGFALVEGATVVATGRGADTVAVPAPEAPRVAWALTHGAVVLALAGA